MLELQQEIELPPLLKKVDRLQIVKYAGASGDFNPLHIDDDYARQKGQEGIIMHGMLGMGFIGELLGNFIGGNGFVKEIKVRFAKEVPVNHQIKSRAKVTKIEPVPNQNHREVHLDVWAENENGDITVKGNAIVHIYEGDQK